MEQDLYYGYEAEMNVKAFAQIIFAPIPNTGCFVGVHQALMD